MSSPGGTAPGPSASPARRHRRRRRRGLLPDHRRNQPGHPPQSPHPRHPCPSRLLHRPGRRRLPLLPSRRCSRRFHSTRVARRPSPRGSRHRGYPRRQEFRRFRPRAASPRSRRPFRAPVLRSRSPLRRPRSPASSQTSCHIPRGPGTRVQWRVERIALRWLSTWFVSPCQLGSSGTVFSNKTPSPGKQMGSFAPPYRLQCPA